MNRRAPLIGVCCVVLPALVAGSGCGGSGPGGVIVASVAGRSVGKPLLDHWMAVELAADGGAAPARAVVRRRVLGLLISWEWTMGEARESGVRVGDAEVAKQLALSRADLEGGTTFEWFPGEHCLEKYLASSKTTTADKLWVLRLGMLAARLAQRRVAVAGSAIARARIVAYYRRHRGRFVVGERRDIRAIMNRSRARVVEAKRELQAGASFAMVAERFNQSIEGGLRLGRARGDQTKRYEKDYFAAPRHVLVGPLKELLYYVFEVMSVRRGYQESLAQAEPAIRHRLAGQDAGTTLLRAYERSWRARTRCRAGYPAAGCGHYAAEIAG